jgi:predicted metallo-beta-lactamase superfamily hydrolase
MKHGTVRVVAELQDERQMRKDGTWISPTARSILVLSGPPILVYLCYRAQLSSYTVGNEALSRAKSSQGMNLTTDVHVVQSPEGTNEFKHAPLSILIHGFVT